MNVNDVIDQFVAESSDELALAEAMAEVTAEAALAEAMAEVTAEII